MIETASNPADAADIVGWIMAEMEDVLGLINRPLRLDRRSEAPAEPPSVEEARVP